MHNKLGLTGLDSSTSPAEFIDNAPDKFTVLVILDKLYALFKNHELTDVDFDTSLEVSEHRTNPIKRKMLRTQDDEAVCMQNKFKPPAELAYNPAKRGSLKDGLFKNKIEFFNNNDLNGNSAANGERKPSPPSARNDEFRSSISQTSSTCYLCSKKVFLMERLNVMDFFMHANCFKCTQCRVLLKNGAYNHYKDPVSGKYSFYCSMHNHKENIPTPVVNPASKYTLPEQHKLLNGDNRLASKYSIDESVKQFDAWKKELFRNRFRSADPSNNYDNNTGLCSPF